MSVIIMSCDVTVALHGSRLWPVFSIASRLIFSRKTSGIISDGIMAVLVNSRAQASRYVAGACRRDANPEERGGDNTRNGD
ncbi:hypothetical protein CQJ27_25840 [Escherichia sp. E1130]|nr:hypothetical protein CQJ27_25840 [Escherichia sp. E1130]